MTILLDTTVQTGSLLHNNINDADAVIETPDRSANNFAKDEKKKTRFSAPTK